ncbi:MAG TPA: D-amino acid aminotransferase [Thiomicrospira sp.]|jgi:D-alanine transaminase|nr:D-amino acid aminotransferase [Thiomicrospira sp.]
MKQTVYLNGQYYPIEEARISPQDRGFLFGDGIYEVIPVFNKKLFEFDAHLTRLNNGLAAISIANPLSSKEWQDILNKLIQTHPWDNQFIYLQVTRGVQLERNHLPDDCLTPSVYAYTNPLLPVSDYIIKNGIKAITLEDIRWLRCDIKAITLLPNVMMKIAAKQQGADDAILINRDGLISEGTASNVFIVQNGKLLTPPTSNKILPGITRLVIENIARDHDITILEQELTLTDLEKADEIWLTSSTKDALPVCQLNGKAVGTGKPGAVWLKMNTFFAEAKERL